MTLPETASFAQFADIAKFKRSYVTALKKANRLVLAADGKVMVAESLQLIRDTSDPSKAGVVRRHAEARAAAAASSPPTSGSDPGATGAAEEPDDEPEVQKDSPYHAHKAERERWLAAAAKRDYEISMRELMPAKDVEAALARIGNALRKDLERLPDVLAPELAPMTEATAVRTFLAEKVEQLLGEMSRQFSLLARASE